MECDLCGVTQTGNTQQELLDRHDQDKNGGWGWKVVKIKGGYLTFCTIECEDRYLRKGR